MVREAFLSFVVVLAACGERSSSDLDLGSEGAAETGSEASSVGSSSELTSEGASSESSESGAPGSSGGSSSGETGASASTGTPDLCGNGILDPKEVCDGDLGIERLRCVDVGYAAGALACAEDCLALDESGCSATAICGDEEVSVGEVCEDGITTPPSCASMGEGSGDLGCLGCEWSVTSCCAGACTTGCDNSCGEDPADLTGTWTIQFINNGWEGADPTMIMELVQSDSDLSGSFTTDAWYIGDHDFSGGTRTGNEVYMHLPMSQLQGGMIVEGTVCGACRMSGFADPQGGIDSDWVGTRG
jgi:hypothetical protein